MKKLLCAVLAIVTLVACLVGFKAAEEKALPVYRKMEDIPQEVADIPQNGNLTMRVEEYPFPSPYDDDLLKEYEAYLATQNVPTELPKTELLFELLPLDFYCQQGYNTVISSQEELSCYYATLIEQEEVRLAEYKAARSLETITGHRAKVVEGDIRCMENVIKSLCISYKKLKETINFETQALIIVSKSVGDYRGTLSKIALDGNRLIALFSVEAGGNETSHITCPVLVNKTDLPAEGNDLQICCFVELSTEGHPIPEASWSYLEHRSFTYNGNVIFGTRCFFDPVVE